VFGWISRDAVPSDHRIAWILDVYRWLLARLGGFDTFRRSLLFLPIPEHYPVAVDDPDKIASAMFELTRKYAGMSEWPCELKPHDDAPSAGDLLGNVPHSSRSAGAAGTFQVDAEARRITITYSPRSLRDPESFVATIAHELSHYLLASLRDPPPGGTAEAEHATDVTAVFLGFGVFLANSAVAFSQFQDATMQGWRMERCGYLTEQELAYALGVFLLLLEIPASRARQHLKTNPSSYLKHALRDLAKHRKAELDAMRNIAALEVADTPSCA